MKKTSIQAALLFLALILIAVGVYRGEPRVILNKAIRVCMECIGLG